MRGCRGLRHRDEQRKLVATVPLPCLNRHLRTAWGCRDRLHRSAARNELCSMQRSVTHAVDLASQKRLVLVHCSGSHMRPAHRAPHISTHGILTDPFSPIVVLALRLGAAAPAAKNTASSVSYM